MNKHNPNRIFSNNVRTIRRSFPRFVSLLIMSFLGVFVFAGLMATAPDMILTLDKNLDDHAVYDLRVISTMGLETEDVEALSGIEGVEAVEAAKGADVCAYYGEEEFVINITSLPKKLNQVDLVDGRLPQAADEIVIEESFLKGRLFCIGDKLKVESDSLVCEEVTVVGTVYSPLYYNSLNIGHNRGNTSVGSGTINYYAYGNEDIFDFDYYTAIYLTASDARAQVTSETSYLAVINAVSEKLDEMKAGREEARYQSVYQSAREEIDDARAEADEELEDAWQELEDAKKELADAEGELADGRQELDDAKKKLADAKKELADSEKKLTAGKKALEDGEKQLKDTKAQIEEGKSQLADAKKTLEEGKAALDTGKAELASNRQQYEAALTDAGLKEEDLDVALLLAEDGLKQIKEGEPQLEDGIARLTDGMEQLGDGISQIDAGCSQLTDGITRLDEGIGQLVPGIEKLDEGIGQLTPGIEKLDEGIGQLTSGIGDLDEGISQLTTGIGDLDEGIGQLTSGIEKSDDTRDQLNDGILQLDALIEELTLGISQLDSYISQAQESESNEQLAQLLAQKAEYEVKLIDLQTQKTEYEAKLTELQTQKTGYEAKLTELQTQKAEYEAKLTELQTQRAGYEAKLTELQSQKTVYESQLAALQDQKAGYESQLSGLKEQKEDLEAQLSNLQSQKTGYEKQLAELKEQKAEYQAQLEALPEKKAELESSIEGLKTLKQAGQSLAEAEALYESKLAEYNAGLEEYESGLAEIEEAERLYKEGLETYESNKKKYEDGLAAYEEGKAEYEDGIDEYVDGEVTYTENYKKYEDGLISYADGLKEYEDAKKEVDEKIADAEAELADIKMPVWYVYDRTGYSTYVEYIDDSNSVRNLAKIFPVVFFAVAVLVSLISMNRMVEEDRLEIGTMKSMGFPDRMIMSKYLLFSLAATLVGGLLGAALGLVIIPMLINAMYGIIFSLPPLVLTLQPAYTLLGFFLTVICVCGTSILTVRQVLKENTASLLRPKAPKNGKRILLERIDFIWSKMKFSKKVTARNIFRYKKRVLVTIGGIAGCTALMLTGFGIKDSIVDIASSQYYGIFKYDAMAVVSDYDEEVRKGLLDIGAFTAGYAKQQVTADLSFGKAKDALAGSNPDALGTDRAISGSLDIVEGNAELYGFADYRDAYTGEAVALEPGKVIINEKLSALTGTSVGDFINITDVDNNRICVEVSAVVTNYLGHFALMDAATYESFGYEFKPNIIYLSMQDPSISDKEKDAVSAEALELDEVLNLTYRSNLIKNVENMLKSLDSVVIILIVLSALLAFVVLYNLSNININERKREIATLKVLGFYDREVDRYITSENMLLTIAGIGLGLLIGIVLCHQVVNTVEIEKCRFINQIRPMSFVYASAMSALFTVIVNIITHFNLIRINMIDSLKSVE